MPRPSEHASPVRSLGADEAGQLAETLKALASPSRLRVLAELVGRERTVEQLAVASELSPSATSHNLRILRSLRLVRTRRSGRHAYYALYDHHVDLLAAVRHHHEHVNAPWSASTPLKGNRILTTTGPAATATGSSTTRSALAPGRARGRRSRCSCSGSPR